MDGRTFMKNMRMAWAARPTREKFSARANTGPQRALPTRRRKADGCDITDRQSRKYEILKISAVRDRDRGLWHWRDQAHRLRPWLSCVQSEQRSCGFHVLFRSCWREIGKRRWRISVGLTQESVGPGRPRRARRLLLALRLLRSLREKQTAKPARRVSREGCKGSFWCHVRPKSPPIGRANQLIVDHAHDEWMLPTACRSTGGSGRDHSGPIQTQEG